MQVMLRILPVQDQIACAFVERIFNHRARKAQAIVVAVDCTDRRAYLDTVLVGIGKSDFFENAKYRRIDLRDVGICQGFVLTTGFTGVYRLQIFGEGRFA